MDLERFYRRLAAKEACRPRVYDDATGKSIVPGSAVIGHPTIGIGHACDVNDLSPDVIRQILREDVAAKVADCRSRLDFFDSLDSVRQEIVVEMAFNLGTAGLIDGFPKMMAALRRKDWSLAAAEMGNSLWASQVGKRATELISAMRSGTWAGIV